MKKKGILTPEENSEWDIKVLQTLAYFVHKKNIEDLKIALKKMEIDKFLGEQIKESEVLFKLVILNSLKAGIFL